MHILFHFQLIVQLVCATKCLLITFIKPYIPQTSCLCLPQGVLTLKNTYLEPRYVLILPLNNEDHERRLRERGIYTEEQIARTLQRADMYVQHNQDHPGFFDMMICSGKLGSSFPSFFFLISHTLLSLFLFQFLLLSCPFHFFFRVLC